MGNYNIGPKIGIEGEREFRQQLKNINDSYKALEAETRAVTAAFKASGDEQGKLEATSKQLQKQIDLQKEKMALLQDAAKKASDKYDENSIEVTRLRGALYNAQATLTGLENELKDTEAQLGKTGSALDELGDDTVEAGKDVVAFGDILKANLAADLIEDGLEKAGEFVKDFASGTIEAAADVKAANAQFTQTFGNLENKAKASLNSISNATNIASTRMQGSYTKIFAFAKTTGTESEAALDIASRAMLAAADSAAYYDRSIEDVAETIQSFLKGNYANDAALGISATETSRNTMANQLYAKSFQELSEAQKVDTLLAMVEAGNKASGAIGQAARESDSWENVTGELTEAYRQLQAQVGKPVLEKMVPVIKKITNVAYELIEDVDWEQFGEDFADAADFIIDNGPKIVKTIASIAAGFVAFKAAKKAKELYDAAAGFVKLAKAAKTAGDAVAASSVAASATTWGVVAAGIGAAASLITSIALNTEETVSDLEKSAERLTEAFENAAETYADTTAEINGSATAAEYYINRLYELEAAGLSNAAANKEYELTVEALNELIPELNLAIDEQTGLVNANKDALLADVDAWKQNAVAKALQEKYSDEIEAYAKAQADLLVAKTKLIPINQKLFQKEYELELLEERILHLNEEIAKWKESRQNNEDFWTEDQLVTVNKYINELETSLTQLQNKVIPLKDEVREIKKEQEPFEKNVCSLATAVDEYANNISDAEKAMERYYESLGESDKAQELASNSIEETTKKIEELTKSYEDAKDAAREAIGSQIGLFDELSTTSEWTAEKVIANWKSQREAFASYQINLKKAKSLGLDDAIVEQLSDGSAESMQILHALVNDTHIRVADINKAFEGLDRSKNNVSNTLADIQLDFAERMDELKRQAGIWGSEVGDCFVVGLGAALGAQASLMSINGLDEQFARVIEYPNIYSSNTPSITSTTNAKTINMGGITVQITAQPGQDVYEIAQAVQDVLQNEINREEAGL